MPTTAKRKKSRKRVAKAAAKALDGKAKTYEGLKKEIEDSSAREKALLYLKTWKKDRENWAFKVSFFTHHLEKRADMAYREDVLHGTCPLKEFQDPPQVFR